MGQFGGKVNIPDVVAVTVGTPSPLYRDCGGFICRRPQFFSTQVKSFDAEDTEGTQGKPAGIYAYYCGPTREEDAGRGAEPLDALRRRALLRGEVSK